MLGGLYKKSTYLEECRKKYGQVIIVDSGDLLNEDLKIKKSTRFSTRLKANLIAEAYQYIGIDAINVGELDLALGLDYIRELEKKYNLPFISANLVDETNTPVFKPYVIKEIKGKKVGIIGLMGSSSDMASKLKEATGGRISVMDVLQSAKNTVKELEGKVDLIIALTHNQMNRNWIIARKVKGIDIVVGGHHIQKLKSPYKAGDTYIVQAGEKGQYQGMIEITLTSDGTQTVKNTLVPLGEKISDDKQVKAMIDRYNEQINSHFSSAQKIEDKAPLAQTCGECHPEALNTWQASDHAKAFDTLVKKEKQFHSECLKCHTTRFEETGGFTMAPMEMSLVNVQCDSCHGNNASHLEDPDSLPKQKPDKKLCIKCHTPDRCPDFEKDYEKEWHKIKH